MPAVDGRDGDVTPSRKQGGAARHEEHLDEHLMWFTPNLSPAQLARRAPPAPNLSRASGMAPPTGLVHRVAITGGTHGNETNGVLLAKFFQKNLPELTSRYVSFEVTVLITNPASVAVNRRYVEEDLNRCFLRADLADLSRNSLEAKRARELNAILGPKGSEEAFDLIIDLHNTTAATRVALMMAPGDELSHAIATHLIASDETVKVCNWNAASADYAMLPSVGKSGMTFEVGPQPWGCADARAYAQSLDLLEAALDYVELHNASVRRDRG